MTSSAASPTTNGATGASEPPCSPRLVEELLRQLTRAVRARQLYLPNNPVYMRAIETLRAAFAPIWEHTGELALQITESEFRWLGHTVLQEASRAEGLPWTCFKDGLRELTFLEGVEGDEMNILLDVLQQVRKAATDSDDLLTLLWEQEFAFLRYRFVDLGVDAAQPILPSAQVEVEQQIPMDQLQRDVAAPPPPDRPTLVRVQDLDSTLYFLDEQDIEYLKGEVHREQQMDLRRNVLAIMLDILELQADPPSAREEACEHIEHFVPQLLSDGDYASVAYLLREMEALAGRLTDLPDAIRHRMRQLPERLSDPVVLTQLLRALDEAAAPPPQAEMDALFEQLRPGTLGVVLGWLQQAQHREVRATLERTATRLASASTGELLKLMLADDQAVATEAMRRAADLKTPAAVTQLAKVVADGAVELRQEAVRALVAIGSPGALRVLESALDDADREVRMLAVRAMAARSHRAAIAKIEAVVTGREVREADLTEKMAFFEAYGLLAGADGTARLDELLNGRSLLLRRRIDPETRACAAMALGKIGSPAALEALRRAGDDKEALVRNAINRALRGGDAS